ncbi:TonB-linked outer membrane protein, SusC/RagA family [Salinivirga cyanobacteriivorans]|uniref:TonB-linked outer membrane protein, SusC/RagA family n=1 Tax=Salinivirga cyanobacteriivorans TaxID=1307839 RepID=A0A0S2I2M2_9BACT|nr:TonB-dependent receptor [Salinivirga cyanobacteriivorans]ALO16443.1 TonB-linked outer membrane protein, SusC/RagA family [Salinivirga cyanobacteriivorans]
MKKITLLTLTFLLMSFSLWAQRMVTGVVNDTEGNTLPGVNVVLKGTTQGTITNPEGKYSIEVPGDDAVLVFSFISYKTEEVQVGDKSQLDVTLIPSLEALSEVVVVGYGVQKKSLVTGAISKVDARDLETSQVRVEQAMQGKTAGVNIMQESGSPGGGITMRIRGTGTNRNANPLFIVDGMRTGGIEYLNPSDIESIEILKDAASAAIYGAAAGNGVVLITTKSGKKGKAKINYTGNFGIQSVRKFNEVLNAEEYASYYRDGLRHEYNMNYFGQEIPEELMQILLDGAFPYNPDTLGEGTDWMNEIFSPAQIQEHNISISGGDEKNSYFFSTAFLSQGGIVGGSKSNFDRITTRINADHKAKDWLEFGTKISYTHFERKSIGENNEFGGVISNAMNIDPITPVYFDDTTQIPTSYWNQITQNIDNVESSSLNAGENGYYGMSTLVQNEIVNPVAQIANTHNNWYTDKLMGMADMTLKPIDGLTLNSSYSIDLSYGNYHTWTPVFYYHSVNNNYLSNTYQEMQRTFSWQWENVATYNKTFGGHDFTALAGHSMRDYNFYLIGGRGEGMLEESWNFAGIGSTLSDSVKGATAGYIHPGDRLLSYFGRLQYNFEDRYMTTLILRSDASSKLSSENRTQYFPSASFGWNVTNEPFWNFDPMSYLKLRFSWGENGNIETLDPFEYASVISTSAPASYYTGQGTLVGAEPEQLSNPDLLWETIRQTNVGIDTRFFNDALAFSTDLYWKKTIGLINVASIPYYIGNNKPNANEGDILNKGIELELSYKGNLWGINYDITAMAAYNHNEVTSLEGDVPGANLGTTGAITYSTEGYPVWYFYGYEADGIFDSFDEINAYVNNEGELIQPKAIPGDVIFKDINGDGEITDDDKTMIGNPHPDWTLGFNANLEYRGFDLKIFLQSSIGHDIYYGAYRTDLTDNNKPKFLYDNAWTPENHTDDFPRYTVNDNNNNFSHNSLFVFDGSFVRLQNLELGYSFQPTILEKIHISKLRLYVSGQNLFVLTKYPGSDPEVGNSGSGSNKLSIGVDRGLYPRPRVISFGINLSI